MGWLAGVEVGSWLWDGEVIFMDHNLVFFDREPLIENLQPHFLVEVFLVESGLIFEIPPLSQPRSTFFPVFDRTVETPYPCVLAHCCANAIRICMEQKLNSGGGSRGSAK